MRGPRRGRLLKQQFAVVEHAHVIERAEDLLLVV
jgi:hypothetical protein